MLKSILAASLCAFIGSAALADSTAPENTAATSLSVTGPQEVGTTSMPPGNYRIIEQTSGKSYELMVSNKGTMILAPAPASASAPAAAAAATPVTSQQNGFAGLGSSAVKKMVQKEVQQGVTNMIEKDAASSLGKFMK